MLAFLNQYAANHKFSQNGEEGILEECLLRIRDPRNDIHCVEIGGNDGLYCSNTAHLIEQGAHGLFVEGDYDLYLKCKENWKDNPRVRAQCCYVDGNNINAFVDERCDVLSIDVDGVDYEIFKGLIARPKIVIVEIDSSILPDVEGFNSDGGASYRTMVELAIQKNYFVLCHTGNLVLIDLRYWALFAEVETTDPIFDSELYFNRAWLKEAA